MHILQIHIYYPVVETEAKCPGRGHTAGSWQSWDSNAAQTPWQARVGDTVPLAIGSSWLSSKSPASIQGPAGHRWGLLDTQWEAEDSVVSGWSVLLIMVEGLCGKPKEENNYDAIRANLGSFHWLGHCSGQRQWSRGSQTAGTHLSGFSTNQLCKLLNLSLPQCSHL